MRYLLSKGRSHGGYNLLELLLSLLALSSLLGIVAPMMVTLQKLFENEQYRYQDEIGIYQLQVLLAVNKVIEVDSDEIIYETSRRESRVEYVNNNLISTPGCVIYLYKIDDVSFKVIDDIIYMEYYRDNEWYEYAIGYKEK